MTIAKIQLNIDYLREDIGFLSSSMETDGDKMLVKNRAIERLTFIEEELAKECKDEDWARLVLSKQEQCKKLTECLASMAETNETLIKRLLEYECTKAALVTQ